MTRVESKQMSMLGAQSEDSKARVQHRPPRRARSVAEQRPGPPPVLCRTHPHIHEHRLQQPERRERTVMVVQTSSVDLDGRTLSEGGCCGRGIVRSSTHRNAHSMMKGENTIAYRASEWVSG